LWEYAPGFVLTAAGSNSQSYVEIVQFKLLIGIVAGEAYQATVQEDIAHLAGYNCGTFEAMTDAEVEALG